MKQRRGGLIKYRILDAYMLKWIAVISMLVDHVAAVVVKGYVRGNLAQLSGQTYARLDFWYQGMRHVGRISFPLFAFLLAEGFFHTRSRSKYGQRLLIAALCSELPFDLALHGAFFDPSQQNVLFTLLLGLVLMQGSELIGQYAREHGAQRSELLLRLLVFGAGSVLAWLCHLDYGYRGIALIGVFYFFYLYPEAAAISGACLFSYSPWSLPAFLLLPFYNGRCGKRSQRWFYGFYPVHLLLLCGILRLLL